MCNIADYNGTRQAAPILLQMIRAQEGLDGGFYTGIATFHEGRLNIETRYVPGDREHLRAPKIYLSLKE